MSRIHRGLIGGLLVAALALLAPLAASAHEVRDLADGKYQVVVGFSDEPAYTGFKNGLDFYVYDLSAAAASPVAAGEEAPPGAPVEGLEATLQVEIIFGDQTMPLVLEPRWQSPGEYDAWVVPMAAGDYTFHIFGTIGETAIDETFTSSPEGFSSVADQAEIQFPKSEESASAAPVFGTVTGDSGLSGGAIGGGLAALAAGAAALWLVVRRRVATPRPVAVRAGAGD